MSDISTIRHPTWNDKFDEWDKWRSVYEGGDDYVEEYLIKFSEREDANDFARRKKISPTPNFAKAAVNDIKNSIFQRLVDVNRRGGSDNYQEAIRGEKFGVDRQGSSMNGFIGRKLLIELLVMSRVGVYVDMEPIEGNTLRDTIGKSPYLYNYRSEDILSWKFKPGRPDEFDSLLLRDYVEVNHEVSGLPTDIKERYRYLFIGVDGLVHVQFYEQFEEVIDHIGTKKLVEKQVDQFGSPTDEDVILQINVIPFVLVELSDSLLADVANHQIALLNLESSDINYTLKSNFPFYVEQDDIRDASHLVPTPNISDGTAAQAGKKQGKEIRVGATQGRRYGRELDAPSFIHPSPEPLEASMTKQDKLKADIRMLVNLSLSNISTKMASAESKSFDERGLEAGLSNIGLELEHAERKIAFYWHLLENDKSDFSVKYPEKWSLKTDDDRRKDASSLRELRDTIPSESFQKSISQEIARLLLADKISNADLDKILGEINDAKSYTADPETIFRGIELGILDLELAAHILGWPKETVKRAAEDHANRLARISAAQSSGSDLKNPGSRGLTDFEPTPGQTSRQEKAASRDTTQSGDLSSNVRGAETEETL